MFKWTLFISLSIALLPMPALAQQNAAPPSAHVDPKQLEKELANPLANLTTLPLQFNFNFNSENDNVSQTVFNIQPVFSGEVGNASLISRFILPIIDNPAPAGAAYGNISGFGDLTYQALYAPKPKGKLIWGGGIQVQAPTGSAALSSRKWTAGPSVVALVESEDLTVGALVSQAWSFSGSSARKSVNFLTIQPFANYRLGGGWSFNPLNNITYDATLSGERWTVPLGLSVIKLLPRRAVPINLTFGVFGNLVHPDDAPDWSMKAQMNFIF